MGWGVPRGRQGVRRGAWGGKGGRLGPVRCWWWFACGENSTNVRECQWGWPREVQDHKGGAFSPSTGFARASRARALRAENDGDDYPGLT